jgi:hypothetical protein
MKNIKDNKRWHNHTYQYKYTYGNNKTRHNHQGNRDTFNPNWSNKIYFRDPGG